jgi:flagellar basal-body rod protein FlgB
VIDRISESLDFEGKALMLRAERQKLIAGNLANADTPGYKAIDMDFSAALRAATDGADASSGVQPARTHPGHRPLGADSGFGTAALLYRQPAQPAIDSNTTDPELERGQFADNAVRYEAALRFLSDSVRTLNQAIRGNG